MGGKSRIEYSNSHLAGSAHYPFEVRIKGSLAKGFLIALAISLIPVAAISAQKVSPGSTCKVYRQKVTNQNKVYTCVKSGKKLVWNTGVAVKKPTSSPTPSPTTTPTSSATSSPITERSYQKLYKSVLSKFQQTSLRGINLEVVYSPTVDQANANTLLDQFNDAISFYVNKFGSDKKVIILFMSEKDKDWYTQKVISYEGSNSNDDWWGSKHCAFNEFTQCGRGTNSSPTNILYEVVGSSWKTSNNSRVSPNHESVHIYQKSRIGDGMYRIFPAWFGEGQANFLGFVTSSRFLAVTNLRSQTIRSMKSAFPAMNSFTETEWVDAINKCEASIDFCVSNGLGYSLGMLINEYLYSNFEPDQIDKVLSEVTAGANWGDSILTNLKVNKNSLYLEAGKYIATEIQDDLKN